MQFVCDAPKGRTWFRIETEAEAAAESRLMRHAVEKHFQTAQQRARRSYVPGPGLERDIGLKGHIARTMPVFLTLRADDGSGLATAMLPPGGKRLADFPIIIVGPENADPYRRSRRRHRRARPPFRHPLSPRPLLFHTQTAETDASYSPVFASYSQRSRITHSGHPGLRARHV